MMKNHYPMAEAHHGFHHMFDDEQSDSELMVYLGDQGHHFFNVLCIDSGHDLIEHQNTGAHG